MIDWPKPPQSQTKHMPLSRTNLLERTIQRIGREIFERAEAAAPTFRSTEFWQQLIMDWLSRNEDLRFRAFRFVEVFPALRTRTAIARHLREYLHGRDAAGALPLPLPLALALSFTRDDSLHARSVAAVARVGCLQMARQFVCGSTPAEAVSSVRRLRRAGMAFTLDVLGETVIAAPVARAHQQTYLDLIRAFAESAKRWPAVPLLDQAPWGAIPSVNISIKLSALVPRFDPIDASATAAAVAEALRPILRSARDRGAFINIDVEHYAVKDLTFDLMTGLLMEPEFRDWPDCGIVIQCYLADAERDVRRLIAWARTRGTPITVRLVKGAYWDYETMQSVLTGRPSPVFTQKWQSDAAFERIGRLMLENADLIRPAFASHNVRSIAAVLATATALDLPPDTLELQMLTGMADPLKRAVVDMGRRLRVYAPFGNLLRGMAYLIRRLIENTSNESFLRQRFTEHTPVQALLRKPSQPTRAPRSVPYAPVFVDPDGEECPEMNPFTNEPDMDFANADNRAAMEATLRTVRGEFGRTYPALVANEPVTAPAWYESLNPSKPSEVVGKTALCDAAVADRAVAAARAAADGWAATPVADRAAVLSRLAGVLHDRRFECAAWQVHEAGKTWREAAGDVIETIDYLRFYAREMLRLSSRNRRRDYPGEANEYRYRPRGVVLVISPFCFPTALLAGMTAAAIVTGNTVVAKPARQASVCGARLIRLFIDSGLPPGVLNLVPGAGRDVGDHLARHPGVDMIAFTGSRRVADGLIAQTRAPAPDRGAYRHLIADMGGKNAIIIDDDADLDEAVQATIASAFGYSGQKCTSCSRAIVLTDVYDAFLARLVEAAAGITPAPAELPGTTVGPLIDHAAVERVRRYVESGRQMARCVLEPKAPPGGADAGWFIGPTIFTDVPPEAPIAQEEILGPVLAVMRAADFDHAIAIANGTPYALTGGVYSRSPDHIERAKRRLHVGVLYINRRITASRVDRQPFGGIDGSGLGIKTGGPDYLRQFVVPQTISENTMRHGFAPTAQPQPTPPPRPVTSR